MFINVVIWNFFQTFHPETTDVYDKKNMPRVIYCIHALSSHLFKLGKAPQIQDLYGKVTFTGIYVIQITGSNYSHIYILIYDSANEMFNGKCGYLANCRKSEGAKINSLHQNIFLSLFFQGCAHNRVVSMELLFPVTLLLCEWLHSGLTLLPH